MALQRPDDRLRQQGVLLDGGRALQQPQPPDGDDRRGHLRPARLPADAVQPADLRPALPGVRGCLPPQLLREPVPRAGAVRGPARPGEHDAQHLHERLDRRDRRAAHRPAHLEGPATASPSGPRWTCRSASPRAPPRSPTAGCASRSTTGSRLVPHRAIPRAPHAAPPEAGTHPPLPVGDPTPAGCLRCPRGPARALVLLRRGLDELHRRQTRGPASIGAGWGSSASTISRSRILRAETRTRASRAPTIWL